MILDDLAILFTKFKLDFIGEQKFNKEVHDLAILFIFEKLI